MSVGCRDARSRPSWTAAHRGLRYLAWLVWKYKSLIPDENMTTIDFPKWPFFMVVFVAFV